MHNWIITQTGRAINLSHVTEIDIFFSKDLGGYCVRAYFILMIDDVQDWSILMTFEHEIDAKEYMLSILRQKKF